MLDEYEEQILALLNTDYKYVSLHDFTDSTMP